MMLGKLSEGSTIDLVWIISTFTEGFNYSIRHFLLQKPVLLCNLGRDAFDLGYQMRFRKVA